MNDDVDVLPSGGKRIDTHMHQLFLWVGVGYTTN